MISVEAGTDGSTSTSVQFVVKNPSKLTEPEKEKVSLDNSLQLIIIEFLDNIMFNNIIKCETAKQMWEKIEVLCERTEEVRSNQKHILVSQYEGFMKKPRETITEVFERLNKLINDLQLYGKY